MTTPTPDSHRPPHPLDVTTPRRQGGAREQLVHDLRASADHAVAVRWAGFAEDHPRLAAVLSRPVLVRAVEADLLDDRSFHQAMHTAALQHRAARTLDTWVRWSVKRLMKV